MNNYTISGLRLIMLALTMTSATMASRATAKDVIKDADRNISTSKDGAYIRLEGNLFVVTKDSLSHLLDAVNSGSRNGDYYKYSALGTSIGIGGLVNVGYQLRHVTIGAITGYNYFETDMSVVIPPNNNNKPTSLLYKEHVIPLLATVGYRFDIGKFSITPMLNGGMAIRLVSMDEIWRNNSYKTTATHVTGMIDGGAALGYTIIGQLGLTLSAKVGYLFGTSNGKFNYHYILPADANPDQSGSFTKNVPGMFYWTAGLGLSYNF